MVGTMASQCASRNFRYCFLESKKKTDIEEAIRSSSERTRILEERLNIALVELRILRHQERKMFLEYLAEEEELRQEFLEENKLYHTT